PFLPREKENWDTKIAFNTTRYFGPEVWYDRNGGEVRAGMCYHVGGNTKLYGAALFRLRERDFERVQHVGGVSPEWPLKYRDFEPYYAEAEKLYQVHGQSGLDPTEPPRSGAFPYPAMSRASRRWRTTWPRADLTRASRLSASASTRRRNISASASAAPRAMAIRVSSTPNPMPKWPGCGL